MEYPENKSCLAAVLPVCTGQNLLKRNTCGAEEEGFEPPDLLQSTVFKTAAIDHSAIPP